MRAALLVSLVSLAACRPAGTFVVLTVEAGAGVPDGIAGLDLTLELGGKSAAAHFDNGGAALTLPSDLVLDIGSGAGAFTITATGTGGGGPVLAQGTARTDVIRGQTVNVTLVLHPPGKLTADRTEYDFGVVTQGATLGPVTFSVTNDGSVATGALQRSVLGDASAFQVTGCEGETLAVGGKCELQVSYKPTVAGSHHLTLTVSGSPGGSVSISVSGTAVVPSAIKIAPAQKDYGPVLVGVTLSQVFTVTNSGSEATGALATNVTGSDAAQFVRSSDGCAGQSLAPQGTCSVTVTFTPSGTTGDRASSLTVTGTPGGVAPAQLLGRALTPASIAFNTATHDFMTFDVGQTAAPVTFTVTNSGGQSTGTLSTSLTGDTAHFAVDMNACTGQMLPYLGTCTVRGHFAPQSFGTKSLTLTVSGTPGGDAAITWTGVGHDQVTLTVTKPFAGMTTGSVTGPGGIDCPTGPCSAIIDRGATAPQVTLTAIPSVESVVGAWSGDCSGTNPQCTLVMNSAKSARPTFDRKRLLLAVTKNNIGSASGTVTSVTDPSESGEIACGATCSLDRYYGASVTLTATPAAGFYFGGWSGDCTGTSRTCVVSMTAARAVVARFTPANKIFTTAASYTIAQVQARGTGGSPGDKMLSGGDVLCGEAGGAGTFRAFISYAGVNARSRIPSTASGWVRPDHDATTPRPFGDTLTSILDDRRVYYPLVIDEARNPVAPSETSWTGSFANGTTNGLVGIDCTSWAANFVNLAYVGRAGAGSGAWVSADQLDCAAASRHLICLQVDYFAVGVVPPTPPAGSRRIFLSATFANGGVGLAALDGLCATDATGNLTGTFRAFVGVNGASPASRFMTRNVPIIRPDGTYIAATDAVLFAGNVPIATPNQHAAGDYATGGNSAQVPQARVRTGAGGANSAGGTNNTCYNGATLQSWTLVNGLGQQLGNAVTNDGWMNGVGNISCTLSERTYCLED